MNGEGLTMHLSRRQWLQIDIVSMLKKKTYLCNGYLFLKSTNLIDVMKGTYEVVYLIEKLIELLTVNQTDVTLSQ